MSRITTVALVLVALAPLGCQATGNAGASSTAGGLKTLAAELGNGKGAINGLAQSVVQMAEADAGDLSRYLESYSGAVAEVGEQAERVRSIRDSLRQSRQAFVSTWDKNLATIQDADRRNKSKGRRDAMLKEFREFEEFRRPAAEAFEGWFQQVTDVEAFLQQDLTPAGVAELSDEFEAIQAGAGDLNRMIDKLVSRLGGLADMLDSSYPKS